MKFEANKFMHLREISTGLLWSCFCIKSLHTFNLKGIMVARTSKVATAAILLSLILTSPGQAQETASLNQVAGELEQVNNLGINASATLNSNLEQLNSTDYTANGDFALTLIFKNFPLGNLNLFLNATKDLTGERQFTMNDGSISNVHNLGEYSNINLGLSLSAVLPISENSIKNTHLNTKLTATPIASYQFKHMTSALDWLSISYRPSVGTYFHDYQVTETGSSNPQYSLAQRAILSFSLSDNFSLDLDGSYTRYYSYQGTTWDLFNFDQSISYAFNAYGSVYIGHNNSGSALAPNGRDSNLDLFDDRSSTVYSGLNIAIP
jgi:hypothetical protein